MLMNVDSFNSALIENGRNIKIIPFRDKMGMKMNKKKLY